jgi:hypothetical protein
MLFTWYATFPEVRKEKSLNLTIEDFRLDLVRQRRFNLIINSHGESASYRFSPCVPHAVFKFHEKRYEVG